MGTLPHPYTLWQITREKWQRPPCKDTVVERVILEVKPSRLCFVWDSPIRDLDFSGLNSGSCHLLWHGQKYYLSGWRKHKEFSKGHIGLHKQCRHRRINVMEAILESKLKQIKDAPISTRILKGAEKFHLANFFPCKHETLKSHTPVKTMHWLTSL